MKPRLAAWFAHVLLSGMLAAPALQALAEEKPLWELGAGLGAATVADYPGSDEYRTYVAPIPYIVYRGKFLKADRGGLRTELFDRRYAELSLSISGSVPVDSDDNDARRGLPDLKTTLELGPRLELHVWRSKDERIKLDIGVPVRFPFTLESSSRSVGVVFEPRLNLKIRDVAGFAGWELGAAIGPNFADRKYHDYFYGIDAAFATPQRPAFEAEGGYSGTALRLNLSKRMSRYWIGGFVRYENLARTAFADSPLVRSNASYSAGLGFAYIFYRSKRMVETDDE